MDYPLIKDLVFAFTTKNTKMHKEKLKIILVLHHVSFVSFLVNINIYNHDGVTFDWIQYPFPFRLLPTTVHSVVWSENQKSATATVACERCAKIPC